jgi:hypothetical protein
MLSATLQVLYPRARGAPSQEERTPLMSDFNDFAAGLLSKIAGALNVPYEQMAEDYHAGRRAETVHHWRAYKAEGEKLLAMSSDARIAKADRLIAGRKDRRRTKRAARIYRDVFGKDWGGAAFAAAFSRIRTAIWANSVYAKVLADNFGEEIPSLMIKREPTWGGPGVGYINPMKESDNA